jgi:hypothetical protein
LPLTFAVNVILTIPSGTPQLTLPEQLRQNLAILPQLAEAGLCNAGKDT